MPDHDQIFKQLLMVFLLEFFRLFLPRFVEHFDFSRVEWLQQEVHPNPPDGERRTLDLVAKLPLRIQPPAPRPRRQTGHKRTLFGLINLEFVSERRITRFRPKFRWYHQILRQGEMPVLPVAVFQFLALSGIGEDEFVESFAGVDVSTFRYPYVALAGLDAEEYLANPNPLAPGLVSMMKVRDDRKVWLKAEAARRIATDPTTPHQKHLLFCCLERYISLTPEQQAEYARLVQESNRYNEVRAMAVTTYEKGIEQGIEQGIERGIEQGIERGRQEGAVLSLRRAVLALLQERFPRVTPKARKRVEALSEDDLMALLVRIPRASSLDDLGL